MTSGIKYVVILYLLLGFPVSLPAESTQKSPQDKKVTINFTVGVPSGNKLYSQFDAICHEIFRRMGYKFELHPLQPIRALTDANMGLYAGDAGRKYDLDTVTQYPNLVRLDEPILNVHWEAYSTDKKLHFYGWDDLKRFKGYVGYQRGYPALDAILPKYVTINNLIVNDNDVQNCKMLMAGRVGIFIGLWTTVAPVLLSNPEWKKNIYSVGVLGSIPVYPYLHKTTAYLGPKIISTLKSMKKDGSYQRIMDQEERRWRKNE